jgi:FkbM family methyltransferase
MKPLRLALARFFARHLPPVIGAYVSRRIYPYERGWSDDHSFRVRAWSGSMFVGTTRDAHAHLFAIHGYFDWRLHAIAAYLCRSGETIVEVGANVGTETIRFADAVGPHGRVFAFEPDPSNLEQIRRMLLSGGIEHVEVIPAAVSDVAGSIAFSPSLDERESGSGHIQDGATAGSDAIIRVDCTTLDSIFTSRGSVHHIFIDAEGAEVMILRGGRGVLRRDRPTLVVEAQEAHLRRFGFGLRDLKAELESHDYRVYQIARVGLAEPQVDGFRPTRNWLALPPSLAGQASRIHRHLVRCGLLPCVRGLNPLTRRSDIAIR